MKRTYERVAYRRAVARALLKSLLPVDSEDPMSGHIACTQASRDVGRLRVYAGAARVYGDPEDPATAERIDALTAAILTRERAITPEEAARIADESRNDLPWGY
jgi:hypothetical protein